MTQFPLQRCVFSLRILSNLSCSRSISTLHVVSLRCGQISLPLLSAVNWDINVLQSVFMLVLFQHRLHHYSRSVHRYTPLLAATVAYLWTSIERYSVLALVTVVTESESLGLWTLSLVQYSED
jgi:hypothetical protein